MTQHVSQSTPVLRRTTETKAAYKTTELAAYLVTAAAVLIAALVVDDPQAEAANFGFGAKSAWLYVTILTSAYLISRGLAKSGTREPYYKDAD